MTTRVELLDIPVIEAAATRASNSRSEQLTLLRQSAETSWIARGEIGYNILRYDDVVAVLRDKRWRSAVGLIVELNPEATPEFRARRRESILSAEGDTHVRLRRLVAPAFSPRNADALRPFMREVVGELLNKVTPSGIVDVARDICEPYPIPIICELLGAPRSDWELFSRWAGDILRVFDNNLKNDLPFIMAAQDELDEYTRALIMKRREEPRDDLLSALIFAEEQGDKLSTEELVMMVEAVIIGGTDTTRNQLGLAVALLMNQPDEWAALASDPTRATRLVEETMRLNGAVRATGRVASVDIEYRGVLFPKGTLVFPSLATANYDPDVFAHPDLLVLQRDGTDAPQLTFGSGIHYCLGASLARAELQEALPLLAARLPDLRENGVAQYKIATAGIYGPTSLPATFTPNPAQGASAT
jgi:cytochrome P450